MSGLKLLTHVIQYDPPPIQYLTIDETFKVIIDANSIWSNQMGIPGIDDLYPWTAFEASSGVVVANVSIAGQQWEHMASNISDVVSAYDGTKTNVLMSAETRNSVMNGKTFEQTLVEIGDYYNAILTALPDIIPVYMEALPTEGLASAADENATILAVDHYVRDHLPEFGIKKYIKNRDISDFSGDGASRQGFMTSPTTCLEGATAGPYVHPTGWPRELLAARMVRDVQRIPA